MENCVTSLLYDSAMSLPYMQSSAIVKRKMCTNTLGATAEHLERLIAALKVAGSILAFFQWLKTSVHQTVIKYHTREG